MYLVANYCINLKFVLSLYSQSGHKKTMPTNDTSNMVWKQNKPYHTFEDMGYCKEDLETAFHNNNGFKEGPQRFSNPGQGMTSSYPSQDPSSLVKTCGFNNPMIHKTTSYSNSSMPQFNSQTGIQRPRNVKPSG